MHVSNLEYKKSILIVILLLLCVVQMGILWSEKNPGVPILFSPQKFLPAVENVDINQVKSFYLRPERIMVSNGNGVYSPLDPKHRLYQSIWNDLKNSYINQVVKQKPVGEKTSPLDWDTLKNMKCILFEFKEPIPVGILQWMTNSDDSYATIVRKIYKIAIFPQEDINNDQNTLYITDDGITTYKYVVKIEQGQMKKDDYIRAINSIGEDNTIISMERLSRYHPSVNNEDLLVSMEKNKYKRIWDLLVKTPGEIVIQRDNIDRIQEYLLDEYKGSMITVPSEDGSSIIFSDDEKVVRFNQNGFFDYRYRNRNYGDKGTAEEALKQALTFIEYRRKNLIDNAEVYLSQINSSPDNYYTFKFDYVIDDMEIKVLDGDNRVKPAIIISANRDRVLDVEWYIKTFEYNDYFNFYSLYFYDFYNLLSMEYPSLAKSPQIADISSDYLYPEDGMRAEPYWLIETNAKPIYMRMRGEGD